VTIDTHVLLDYIVTMQTIDAFDREFASDEDCKRFLVEMRWPDGVKCPRCGEKEKVYALKARPFHWVCKSGKTSSEDGTPVICHKRNGYRFSLITHTIFEDTKIGLKLWFKVAYLVLTAKKGISALQVHRVIFGEDSTHDYHTSWYMVMRWRAAMKGDALPLGGEIEIDETFVGGKNRNRHRNKRFAGTGGETTGKVAVIGAIARKGMVVARTIQNTDTATLDGFVRQTVDKDRLELISTDEHSGYRFLKRSGLPHASVSHGQGEYVRGLVHTNNLESFWSLIKRDVMGQYHHVSKKYLPLYLNEFSWRFNNRKNPSMFADLIQSVGK
jgi:transposase-like protein